MKKTYDFLKVCKSKKYSSENSYYTKEGITMRLLEKYKPGKGLSQVDILKKIQEQKGAA